VTFAANVCRSSSTKIVIRLPAVSL